MIHGYTRSDPIAGQLIFLSIALAVREDFMGIKDWFRRKREPKQPEGAEISDWLYRSLGQPSPSDTGPVDATKLAMADSRRRVYAELFGAPDAVLTDPAPDDPVIDVLRFPPSRRRKFYTYVTSGMSERPMRTPEGVGSECRRAELIFYTATARDDYGQVLGSMACFVHLLDIWLHWGAHVPHRSPPEPLFGTRLLDTLLFLPSKVTADGALGEKLRIQNDPVQFLWCVPITTAESRLLDTQGMQALAKKFDANRHPIIFSGDRDSYV
jgi:hypothetical protein